MKLLAFKFTKMHIAKNKDISEKVTINNNIKITNVEEEKISLPIKVESALKYSFLFTSNYEPNIGLIELAGDIVSLEKSSDLKEILKDWKDNKKLAKKVQERIFKIIIDQCIIQATVLTKDVHLPNPLILPPKK